MYMDDDGENFINIICLRKISAMFFLCLPGHFVKLMTREASISHINFHIYFDCAGVYINLLFDMFDYD